jgi:hypothetical protein
VSEVLDRVLDRGIVIDAWLRISVAGIALIDVDARIVVASIETHLCTSDRVDRALFGSPPAPMTPARTRAPRRGRRARVRLRCERGCTLTRPAGRCPASVRCPFERARSCPVAVIPLTA